MIELFGTTVCQALEYACYLFAGTIGLCLLPNIAIAVAREFCTITVVELDE